MPVLSHLEVFWRLGGLPASPPSNQMGATTGGHCCPAIGGTLLSHLEAFCRQHGTARLACLTTKQQLGATSAVIAVPNRTIAVPPGSALPPARLARAPPRHTQCQRCKAARGWWACMAGERVATMQRSGGMQAEREGGVTLEKRVSCAVCRAMFSQLPFLACHWQSIYVATHLDLTPMFAPT